MSVSHRLCCTAVMLSLGFIVSCTEQSSRNTGTSPADSDAATTAIDIASPPPSAMAQDVRSSWLSAIEKSGEVDLEAIDTEIQNIRTDLIIDQYFESLYAKQVSSVAIEEYYRDHQDKFVKNEVNVAHILLRIPASASDEKRSATLTHAHELLSRLHAGEDFAVVAKAESEDVHSSQGGGALGWVGQGQIPDSIISAAMELDVGAVSDPIIEKHGIHIVKKIASERAQAKPLSAVRARITQLLREQVKQQAIQGFTSSEHQSG